MPFFDAHIHTTFKAYLTDGKLSIWDKLKAPSILKSQSTMQMIKDGDIQLAVIAIYPIERGFSGSVLIQLVGPKIRPVSRDKLNDLINKNYFDMIWEELDILDKDKRKDEFHFLQKASDFQPGKVNMVFSVEGGLALYGEDSVEENLLKLKNHPKFRFFSLNLTHLTQMDLAAHAFGMKLLKGNDEFKPNGKGITERGLKLVDLAYNKSKGRRIFIDLKHMSLFSRKQFYAHVKNKNVPILASHIGLTGFSYNDIHKYVKGACVVDGEFVEVEYDRVKGIGDTHFNPWSINFYDEEIKAIVDSGGLIGLSLDQRIQGADRPKGEYFSIREFRHVVKTSGLKIELKDFRLIEEVEEETKFGPKEFRLNVRKHLRHMSNTILHAVRIGGEKTWNHLCFGSDFDGLINPLNCCQSADEYDRLKGGLLDTIPKMIKKAKKKHPGHRYFDSNLEKKVDQICFDNGMNFMKKHLK